MKPNKAKKGMIIPKDILIDGSTYLQKYNMPASGRQTSGGGVLADSLSVDVQSGIQAEENIMLGTSTEIYASPEHKAGKAYKNACCFIIRNRGRCKCIHCFGYHQTMWNQKLWK